MATTTAPAVPDTQSMVVVHRLFRRELRLLPDLIRGVAGGDLARARVVADHCSDVLWGLHHHHESEDELLWPKLLDRATPDIELIHRMEEQHQEVADGLTRAEMLLPSWRATAAAETGRQLATAIDVIRSALLEHFDEEEEKILPLVRVHITVQEWNELGERGAAAFPRRKMLIFLGAILEDASPAERKAFLAELPAQPRFFWRLFGLRGYRQYIDTVRNG